MQIELKQKTKIPTEMSQKDRWSLELGRARLIKFHLMKLVKGEGPIQDFQLKCKLSITIMQNSAAGAFTERERAVLLFHYYM